ncbi:alpha/beta hydrolase family protein [Spirochaeta cellobiosiphila]|uniref:alpha/beta hydrolase family protein n=1 Tax=Spirochaeta cellobiosiphila TaxID=504483 RepID=UPI0004021D8D|nr:hypothetical protein [Spirochaeta cellobiosiphila]
MATQTIDELDVLLVLPQKETLHKKQLVLWLPYLGGTKEGVKPHLDYLASQGYHALSIDPYRHGGRSRLSPKDLHQLVFSNFRTYMWEILGRTILDSMKAIDWCLKELPLSPQVLAGGLSMGGDIAISLSLVDARISKVAALGSTPDWTRPGMTEVFDSNKIIPQGSPSFLSQWYKDQFDPMTRQLPSDKNLNYHITLGELDTHISPNMVRPFEDKILTPHSNSKIKIDIIPDVNHIELLQNEDLIYKVLRRLIHG